MVNVRFRKVTVKDGVVMELPESTARTILYNPKDDEFFVTWLEEVKE